MAPFDRLIPREANVFLIPDRENQEVGRKIGIVNAMLGVKVLAANSPTFRNLMGNLAMKGLNPSSGRMIGRIHRTSMKPERIKRSVFTIHLLGDHYLFALEMGAIGQPTIVIRSPG